MSGSAERFFQLRNYYGYNLLFWFLLCALEIVQTFSFSSTFGFSFDPVWLIRWPFSVYLCYWILSLLVIRFYIQSVPWKTFNFLAYHAVASVVFGILHKMLHPLVGLLLERLILPSETIPLSEIMELSLSTSYDFLSGTAMYWLLILILRALTYFQRLQERTSRTLELEKELGSSRLHTMKIQMRPHFLFNAFNTISMMVRSGKKEEATEMISDLSDMLRQSLSDEVKQFIKLSEELELTRKYVNVESRRYGERVNVEWDIDKSIIDQQIPSMILQPLVENAFKHGVSKSLDTETIRISCQRQDNFLTIEVFNTGSELEPRWDFQKSKGIGLSNTSERLSKLYKSEVKLLIREQESGISVKIIIPLDE